MLRRFNYTGRRKIKQEDVPVTLVGTRPLRGFDANLSGLAEYGFPAEAHIYVEAYEHAAYMRFDFGTIQNIAPPNAAGRLLTEFEGSDVVRFRVKVVDIIHEAQILGEADGILPLTLQESEQNKLSLLPIRAEDLGQELWRLDFPDGSLSRPVLIINSNAGNPALIARSPAFMSLAWPAILREI